MECELVVIGTSLGGLRALETILAALPEDFKVPIVIVQHRMPESVGRLVALLQLYSRLRVKEPEDKEVVRRGFVYLAPADYHLLIEEGAFSLSTDAPVISARPSIDVLFESAADACDQGVIGVVLTGASADGAAGAAKIKQRGGVLVVQDPADAESAVMPRAALKVAKADWVAPLPEIGPLLVRLVMSRDENAGSV